jgi:integrase
MKLTEKMITKLSLPDGVDDRLISDDELDNFGLRLRRRADGQVGKSWILRYWIAGKERRATLDFAGQNLASARKWASDLKARIRLGLDPSLERTRTRADAEQTLGAAIAGYLAIRRPQVSKSTYYIISRHLLAHWQPLHRIPLRQVSIDDVSRRCLALADTASPHLAASARRWLSTFFVWAMRRGLVDRNPCLGVDSKIPTSERKRVLNMDKLKALWSATDDDSAYSSIVRLLLLSGSRLREIGELEWREVCSDRVELPPPKTRRAHTIHLTPRMRELIDSRDHDQAHVFAKRGGKGPFSGWGYGKALLDKRSLNPASLCRLGSSMICAGPSPPA